MKKRILIITTISICMLLFLTACSNRIDKATIMKDIEPNLSEILSDDETLDDIEILDYYTDDIKDTVIHIKAISSNDIAEYNRYLMVTYFYSSDDKWVFGSVSQEDEDKSTVVPHKGVNEEIISSSLRDEYVEINGETWNFNESDIKNISIEKQETNLDKKEDKVTVNLSLDDKVQSAEGKLTANYYFDKSWKLDSFKKDGEFKINEKKDCELNLTDEDLLSELVKNDVKLFEDTSDDEIIIGNSNIQTISMSKDEISDFEVYEESSQNKGTDKRYYCKATLTKPNAVIKMDCEIQYIYEGSWLLQPTTITAKLDSIDIEGEWEGTYSGAPYGGKSSLKITEVTKDGKIKGIYSYTPDTINQFSKAGSYKVSGTIDMSSMIIKLTEDNAENVFTDITATFYINESKIEGLGQEGNPFVLKKAD